MSGTLNRSTVTTHELRDYQRNVITGATNEWNAGARNVLAVLPTGAGKTVVFAYVIANHPGAAVAIAHRSELVSQMSLALAREGVRHRVIGPPAIGRTCAALHMSELGRMYVDPGARCAVAGVDSLVRMDKSDPWFAQVTLWVQDESHHVLADNKWGDACKMFPNARGLGVTATPVRADGKGLGRHADGVMDAMVVGPSMRELIQRGYLTEYRVFAPPSDLDLSQVTTSASGDYSPPKLKAARQQSHITGDVVAHYLRIAKGKLGITFDTDIESAEGTAAAYRAAGVNAQVVSSKTPDALRAAVLRQFRNREVMQLVNVDLFGEGFDLPALEVVSMARPTQSYGLYCLDPETEVLTPSGWLRCNEALQAAEVVAFDPADGSCRSAPVTGRVKRERYVDEGMFGIDSPHLSILVSDQHRMVVRAAGGTAKNWQFQEARHVAERAGMFRVPVAAEGIYVGSGLTDGELRFLGWFLSDGGINRKTNGLTISQSAAKPEHLASIRSAIEACGFKYREHHVARKNVPATHNDLVLFTVSRGAPRGTDKHLTGYGRLGKWLDKSLPACFDKLTRAELLTLLSTWNLGDGLNNTGSLDYTLRSMRITCGDNLRMADRLQALCVTRGLRCNQTQQNVPGRSTWSLLYIKDVQTSTVAGTGCADGRIGSKAYRRSRFAAAPSAEPAFVWCLTNDLGTLITRRWGKVAIVGNCQQFGRVLRLMEGKTHGIVIDHVGNVARHGLPDARREWTLDRRERRSRSAPTDVIPVRTCLNEQCLSVYERIYSSCPYCGHEPVPAGRSAPEQVDGDLHELDAATLAALRGEVARVDGDPVYPYGAAPEVQGAVKRRHWERQQGQAALRASIALWAGWQGSLGRPPSEIYRRFFFAFGTDVMTAQALGTREAEELNSRVSNELARHRVVPATSLEPQQ